ncbi:septal ring lytic transglycosylase RlpA family protein [Desulfovibrio gilichinskyi]|uniref:Probable endolytic peptidoglycan transglycosylase RlpA n=1 Tax=Desulfovibrio gilichinskyi TaxID=1519643 RepID=A0A1X7EEM2_9BACT|nr:septal ring lytic transglycosylase RlpA family protein [Desulfovibrio gilichinskyi]SMF32625.1 rare lipoprotein A [Desulfovibrio gilichinskyi]
MKNFIVCFSAVLLLFTAGCAKKIIHSSRPLSQPKIVHRDTPNRVNPVLKIDPYTIDGRTYVPHLTSKGYKAVGLASWYGDDFHGRTTANGETYNMYAMTAAHRTLPMGSMVEVTDLQTGKKVIVRVNDRGPFADPDRRIIDLSYAAASKLGISNKGITSVELRSINDVNAEPMNASEIVASTAAPLASAVREETLLAEPAVADIFMTETPAQNASYFIQVGSFTEQDRAESILESLRKEGYNESRMMEVTVNGATYIRVQAGHFASLNAAEEALNSLRNEFSDLFIVTE